MKPTFHLLLRLTGSATLLLMASAAAGTGSEPVWAGRFDRGMAP